MVSCASSVAANAPSITSREVVPANAGRMPLLIKDKLPIDMDFDNPRSDDLDIPELMESGYRSAVSIPIVHDGEVLGVFDLVYRSAPWWNQDDLDYLCEVGRFIGAAIRQDASRDSIVELRGGPAPLV